MRNHFFIAAVSLICLVYMPLEAKRVKGSVSSQGAPLGNVIVSDGYRFTKTAQDGSFKFNTHKNARFVFIVTPSGYVADYSSGVPQFYMPVKGNRVFKFDLQPLGEGEDYTIFSISDPQMQNKKHLKRFKERPLEDLRHMADSFSAQRPTVGMVLGDVAWNKLGMFDSYKEVISTVRMPFYTVIGNHDFIQNRSGVAAAEAYEAAFGPYNYALWMGKDLLIGVNSLIFKASGLEDPEKSSNNYSEGYPEETLDFVKGLLEFVPKGTHIYMAQHSPIRFVFEFKSKDIDNAGKMLEILDGYPVEILSGHTHIMNTQVINASVTDHNAAAIGGAWWATDWCKDGSPRGYQVISSVGGQVSWDWHNIDYPDSFQVSFTGIGKALRHPESIVANVWMADSSWTVDWYQDGKYMGAAEQVWETSSDYTSEILEVYKGNFEKIPKYKRPLALSHFYAVKPAPEAESVTIVVKAPDGREWSKEFSLKED